MRLDTLKLIAIPAAISLVVTLVRLLGELFHWSERWFTTRTLNVVPAGLTWVFGITWLALPFGAYFAWRLVRAGYGPASRIKLLLCVVVGIVITLAGLFLRPPLPFPQILLYIWLTMVIAAAVQLAGWPELVRVLLAYGLAARIPVVVVMFFAMLGNWGTHYDYVGMPAEFNMSFWPRFLWLAFFPQLIFWVGYTILTGSLAGSIVAAVLTRKTAAEQIPLRHEDTKKH
jgi:hypothetical protein